MTTSDSTWGALGETAKTPSGSSGDAAPGASFGRFVTTGVLGRGGMGIVLSAHDPELDRKVAIKLLHPGIGDDDQARLHLQLEAQAMARLAHPNVVTIYEVGRANGQVFIAMELVEGSTLKSWLGRKHPWREIVSMFVAAGRGLAAAHRDGIVHRDFKPENVLIGPDGRPRVGDFGLAERGRVAAVGTSSSSGSGVGTPAYMSPEQWSGEEVDVRTDQFSFCVALWAAVWGQAPFAGTDTSTLRGSVLAGKRRAIPARSGVPRWLEPILTRGLAIDRDDRWPSLGDLLDAIERRMSARRRATVIAAVAAAIGAAAIAVTVMSVTRTADDPCAPPTNRLDTVWGQSRRASIQQHLAEIDPALGPKRFAAVSAVLDHTAPAWSDMYVGACRATRVDGRQSDTMLDLRMSCLDDWLGSFDNIAKNLENATNASQLEGAIKGVSTIAELSRCADTQLLQLEAPPPVDPVARAEGDAIVAEARAIMVAIRGGKWDGLEARGDALVARARKIAHPAALAKAIGIRARIAVSRQDTKGAMAFLREDVEAAARAHNDDEVAKAWSLMVRLSSMFQGHPEEAKAIMPAARAASARIGDPPLLLAQVLTDEADVLSFHGDTEHALADLDRARHLLEAAGATQPGSPSAPILGSLLHSLGNAYWNAEKLDLAETNLRDAIAVIDRAYGPDTVESSSAYLALGQVLRDDAKLDDAETALRESVRIREARAPDSGLTATALVALADVLDSQPTKIAEGIAVAERGVAMARKTMPVDATFAGNLASLADAYAAADRYKEAIAIYDEMFVIVTANKIEDINVASWELNRGEIYRKLDRCDDAIAAYQRGARVGVKIEGPTSHYIASAARATGFCLHDLHRDVEAMAALESSIASPPPRPSMSPPFQIARGLLGELLVDTGRDRARGLALAKEAGEALHALHAVDPFVAAHDAWLKRH